MSTASYTITCPSCAHEWQTLKVGRRARTCPSCGHVGPRAAFAEKPTPTTSDPATAKPPTNGEIHVTKPKEDHPVKRKLGGAALAAHEAKARGEPVTVGKPFGASAKKSRGKVPVSGGHSSAKPIGILERLKRVVI